MCGIFGTVVVTDIGHEPLALEAISQKMLHRGPDSIGCLFWTHGQECHLTPDPD